MYICSVFSARYGWWNEQTADDRSWVTALKHIVKANILAMHRILDVRGDAIFIQSESSEHFHPGNPEGDQARGPLQLEALSVARPELLGGRSTRRCTSS